MTEDSPLNSQGSDKIGLTIGQFGNYLAPGVWNKAELLEWPPDVFAVAASILLKSGAYCHAVSGWEGRRSLDRWIKTIRTLGQKWRNGDSAPRAVRRWQRMIVTREDLPIFETADDDDLCDALLQLCSAADEACAGVGFGLHNPLDSFLLDSSLLLYATAREFGVSTLCRRVHHSVVRVLPKLHTPQSGITIRSLTHHLALCPAGDVKGQWTERARAEDESEHCLNLLLVPWPLSAKPAHFRQVDTKHSDLPDMPDHFSFFEYAPPEDSQANPRSALRGLLKQANQVVDRIHGVVFPELALNPLQHSQISGDLMKEDIFLISGVREPPSSRRKAGENYFRFDIPSPFLKDQGVSHKQSKHHRWQLDKRQIVQYGLGSCLDLESKSWEHIGLGN